MRAELGIEAYVNWAVMMKWTWSFEDFPHGADHETNARAVPASLLAGLRLRLVMSSRDEVNDGIALTPPPPVGLQRLRPGGEDQPVRGAEIEAGHAGVRDEDCTTKRGIHRRRLRCGRAVRGVRQPLPVRGEEVGYGAPFARAR